MMNPLLHLFRHNLAATLISIDPDSINIISIIVSLISAIVTVISIWMVTNWYKGYKARKQVKKTNDISPIQIMDDRGNIKYGYLEDSWCTRDIEHRLVEAINDKNSYITVITGHYASGKSRLVYHYLKSKDCPFSRTYAPDTSELSINEITNVVRYIKAKKTIIIIDDIDDLYKNSTTDDLGLSELFSTIHNKGIKTIVTLTNGTKHFDQFLHNCNDDSYKGKKPQKRINHIAINDIELGDDCHLWCVSNLKNEGFSTVIGGYVTELSREIPKSINSLTDDEKKALVTYYISTKFRRHEGREKQILASLHKSLWHSEEDFNSSLGHLVKIGFLKRQTKGRRGDPEYKEYYLPANRRLYDAFIIRSATNQVQNRTPLDLHLYTASTPAAEKKQIDAFLQIEPGNAILYSRAISHCLFNENVQYIESKIWEYLKDKSVPQEFYRPIGDLIRRKPDGFESAKKWISMGYITLNEIIVSNLIIRPQAREEINNYLKQHEDLVTDENAKTVFYHYCKEIISTEYDITRTKRAYDLFQENKNDRYTKQNYSKYCECLLKKANSLKRIENFWNLIRETELVLLLNRNAIRRYFKELSKGNKRGSKDSIIIKAYKEVCNHWDSFTFIQNYDDLAEIRRDAISTSMTKTAIEKCQESNSVFVIYDIFCKHKAISNEQTKNMVSYDMFDKLDPNNKNNISRFRSLLINRILETPNQGAAAFKMINKYLEKMTSLEMVFDESETIKHECEWEGELIDRDTINVMLKVVRSTIIGAPNINKVIEDIDKVIKFQTDFNFVKSPYFKTEIYSCARELIKKGATSDQVSQVLSYASNNYISNRDTINENERFVFDISERARPASITDINEANKLVIDCILYIKNNEYLHPDIIANILLMYSISFSKHKNEYQRDQLKNNIEKLINEFDDKVKMPNMNYCTQLLYYILREHTINIDNLKAFIVKTYEQLFNMGDDLSEGKPHDLFGKAINHKRVSVEDALSLLKEASNLGKMAKHPRDYRFKARLITYFVKKINENDLTTEKISDYMFRPNGIQDIINENPYLDYSVEATRIIGEVKKFDSGFGLEIPITSRNVNTRHNMWDYYVTEQKTYMLDERTINEFIRHENDDMKSGKNPNGLHYIDQANKELQARKPVYE